MSCSSNKERRVPSGWLMLKNYSLMDFFHRFQGRFHSRTLDCSSYWKQHCFSSFLHLWAPGSWTTPCPRLLSPSMNPFILLEELKIPLPHQGNFNDHWRWWRSYFPYHNPSSLNASQAAPPTSCIALSGMSQPSVHQEALSSKEYMARLQGVSFNYLSVHISIVSRPPNGET